MGMREQEEGKMISSGKGIDARYVYPDETPDYQGPEPTPPLQPISRELYQEYSTYLFKSVANGTLPVDYDIEDALSRYGPIEETTEDRPRTSTDFMVGLMKQPRMPITPHTHEYLVEINNNHTAIMYCTECGPLESYTGLMAGHAEAIVWHKIGIGESNAE